MHDPTSTPLGTLVLDAAWTIQERCARTDECETSVCLTGGGAISPILSDERMQNEFGGVESTLEVHFDRFQTRGLWRVLST